MTKSLYDFTIIKKIRLYCEVSCREEQIGFFSLAKAKVPDYSRSYRRGSSTQDSGKKTFGLLAEHFRIKLVLLILFCLAFSSTKAQVELRIAVNSGTASTTCRDFLFLPNVHWSVLTDGQEWVVYPATVSCFQSLPNLQLSKTFNCEANIQNQVQVCFRAFDNDGTGCNVQMECMEEICEFFPIPALGDVEDHTLSLPIGGSSRGSVNFSISLVGDPVRPINDIACNAVDFGTVPLGAEVGDASVGNHNNICGTALGDPNPKDEGNWANDRGVWFKFNTDDQPGTAITIEAQSDPLNTGDEVALQFALYKSENGCDGPMEFVAESYDFSQPDETMILNCPEANTEYYLLVDGPEGSGLVEGVFGIEVRDNGIPQRLEVIDTVLCFGNFYSVGINAYNKTGTYRDVFSQLGECDIVIISNVTVLEELTAFANEVAPVSFEGLADGEAEVIPFGGAGNFTYKWTNGSTSRTPNDLEAGVQCVTITDSRGCETETCVTIETDLFPIKVSLDAAPLACFGDDNGSIVISLLGGEPPYQYGWKKQGEDLSGSGTITAENEKAFVNNLPSGKYVITIQDNSSLSTSLFTEVLEPEEVRVVLDTTVCAGERVQVGDVFYESSGMINEILTTENGCDSIIVGELIVLEEIVNEWAEERCAGEIFPFENQTYTSSTEIRESYTSAFGCDSTVIIQLTILDELEIELEQYQLATGYAQDNGAVRANIVGGDGNYNVEWSDGQSGITPLDMTGGEQYCVKVSDGNGCEVEECIQVEYIADNIASVQNDTLKCFGEDTGALTIRAGLGQGPYQYTWKSDDGNLTGNGQIDNTTTFVEIPNLPAGAYEIEISDVNVSTTKSALIIDVPPMAVQILDQREISCKDQCDGAIELSFTGGLAPYTFQWGAFQWIGDISEPLRQADLCADNYSIQVTDANGCSLSENFVITEPLIPLSATIDILAEPSCNGESDGRVEVDIIGATGDVNLKWSNGSNNIITEDLSAGEYLVTVSTTAGCTTIERVVLEEPELLDFNLAKADPTCTGGQNSGSIAIQEMIGGTAPYIYSINDRPFQAFDEFQNLPKGEYKIITEDANGCRLEKEVSLTEPQQPVLKLVGTPETQLGEPVAVEVFTNADVVLNWYMADDLVCGSCDSYNFMPLRSTPLRIVGTNPSTGCETELLTEVRVIKNRNVFIPTAFSPNGDGINDILHIHAGANVTQVVDFKVFDRYGTLVHQAQNFQPEDPNAAWNGRFRSQALNQGVYVYYAEIEYVDGEQYRVQGDVTLLR